MASASRDENASSALGLQERSSKLGSNRPRWFPRAPLGRHNALVGLAQQFGHPRGFLGAIVGRGMAGGNAALSRWAVQQVKDSSDGGVRRAAELGPEPGVGLEALLAQFPEAQVWGIDLSSGMLSQSTKRNR